MTNEVIEHLKRYCDGKENTEKVEISVLQLHRIIKALEQQTCEDAVSREAVLGLFAQNADAIRPYSKTWEEVKALSSVNPQYTEDEIQKMQDLEQAELEKAYELGRTEGQKSEDAVSRQAAIDAMYALCDTGETLKENPWRDNPYIDAVVEAIEQIPSVNPQPKIGHWKKMVEVYDLQQNRMLVPYSYDDAKFGNTPVYVCDCGCESNKNSRFCPDCGAKMVEPQESEDLGDYPDTIRNQFDNMTGSMNL